ncbi:MAG: hypothetical protein GNW80_01080 [Asgard group archaeon]|nr:hypothetical protein [Candidatus Heimdallarchaeota archaeon]MCK5157921.1 hypothetical protein [Candidatus Heimdallarchaeota archaeon]NPE06848.1 hypothetical protein [Asgard group archaeon]
MYSGRLQPILHVNLDIIENIKGIPDNIQTILTNAIAFLIAICFAMGVILAIVGAIQWATGWDDRGGKKTVVKGIVLIGISLLSGGGILAGYMYL